MLQNMWDARILTAGVSTQRGPMSTAPGVINPSGPFRPTPDALVQLLQLPPPHWVLCLLGNNGSVGGETFRGKNTAGSPVSPRFSPAPSLLSSPHTNTVLFCHPGWRRRGQKFSRNGNMDRREYNVLRARNKHLTQQRRLRSDTFGHTSGKRNERGVRALADRPKSSIFHPHTLTLLKNTAGIR